MSLTCCKAAVVSGCSYVSNKWHWTKRYDWKIVDSCVDYLNILEIIEETLEGTGIYSIIDFAAIVEGTSVCSTIYFAALCMILCFHNGFAWEVLHIFDFKCKQIKGGPFISAKD